MTSHTQRDAGVGSDAAALRADALDRYRRTRGASDHLARPLSPEDMTVQSMPDASPAKWHLAHTTWFFETFLLERFDERFEPIEPAFRVLFNSYYNAVGAQYPRSSRGVISRPGADAVRRYRAETDRRVAALLENLPERHVAAAAEIVELGIQHEQQHQELLVTDIKHALSMNPLAPAYRDAGHDSARAADELSWLAFDPGVSELGVDQSAERFAYDNESPRHRVFLEPFEIAARLLTNAEFAAFIADGGYERSELWLDEGWTWVRSEDVSHPLYWRRPDAEGPPGDAASWREFTLAGERPLDPNEPVCHLSMFEADAAARWLGARLPTEAEWEHAARSAHPDRVAGYFLEDERLHPNAAPCETEPTFAQCFGDCWEWTGSQYRPYPGYTPPAGALGEYNGKFMSNQFVLRGGSCATPRDHVRTTYRNFFPPTARWQFAGVRLARSPR